MCKKLKKIDIYLFSMKNLGWYILNILWMLVLYEFENNYIYIYICKSL